MRKFISLLAVYLLMVGGFVFLGSPEPGYERLWIVSAFVAAAIYLSLDPYPKEFWRRLQG